MGKLTGKVVVITGASTGIGRAIAEVFAEEGAAVVLGSRDVAAGEAVAGEIRQRGGQAVFQRCDVVEDGAVAALVALAVERFGRLDAAVNNAGVDAIGAIVDSDEATFARVFDVNVKGLWRSIKAELPALARGGSIVNIGSIAGTIGMVGMAIYSGSKGAVDGMSRAVAIEVAAQGIRVNVVAPGAIRTAMLERVTGGNIDIVPPMVPLGRVGEPVDVARACVWLTSDDAAYVTGQTFHVDGGFTAQ